MKTLIQLPVSQHIDVSAGASVPQGDSILIQNVDADEVWVYEAATAGTIITGTMLRRGETTLTPRGSLGVFAVSTRGDATISAGPVSDFQTFRVDNEPIALLEGRQFRVVRKVSIEEGTPLLWKFSARANFQLIEQELNASAGDIEVRAYRAADVTETAPFNNEDVPIFGKNITDDRRLYDGQFYERKNKIFTGGAVTLNNPDNYVDYNRSKTSGATAQQISVSGGENSLRNLLGTDPTPTDYYLEYRSLVGTSEGRVSLAWTEFI